MKASILAPAFTAGAASAAPDTPIGRLIEDAELCVAGMTADECRSRLVHLPLR